MVVERWLLASQGPTCLRFQMDICFSRKIFKATEDKLKEEYKISGRPQLVYSMGR